VGGSIARVAILSSVGVGMGTTAYFIGDTGKTLGDAQRQALTRTGANLRREPIDVNYTQIEKAQSAFGANVLLSALGAGDVAVLSRTLAQAAVVGAKAARSALVEALAGYRGAPADFEKAATATTGLTVANVANLHSAFQVAASDVNDIRGQLVTIFAESGRSDLLDPGTEKTVIPLIFHAEKEVGTPEKVVATKIKTALASPSCAR
jgi:hypothetical protein